MNNYIIFESQSYDRADAPPSYATFFNVRTTRRLETIKVFNGGLAAGNLVRHYVLDYQESNSITHQSMLDQIMQYGSNGTALPPVNFTYTADTSFRNNPLVLVHSDSSGPGGSKAIAPGDFTGDGRTDLLVTDPDNIGSGWQLYHSDGTSFSLLASGSGMSGHSPSKKLGFGDFNGDHLLDVLVYSVSPTLALPTQLFLANGSGFDPAIDIDELTEPTGLNIDVTFDLFIGDFNGDGQSDILKRFKRNERKCVGDDGCTECITAYGRRIYLSNGSGFADGTGFELASEDVWYSSDPFNDCADEQEVDNTEGKWVLGDFNGDGKTDLLAYNFLVSQNLIPGPSLYLSTGSDFVMVRENISDLNMYNRRFHLGDFNGDGKTDFVITFNTSGENAPFYGYQLFISTGDDFVLTDNGTRPSFQDIVNTGDFNGDGRTDLLITNYIAHSSWPGYIIRLSTGLGFEDSVNSSDTTAGDSYHVGDFDGDGIFEFMSTSMNWSGYKLYHSTVDQTQTVAQSAPNLLGSITNMLGATTDIVYKPSTIWPKDIDGDGSYHSMPMALPTAASVTITDNMGESGHTSSSTFAYEGGLYDIPDEEFRGFGKVAMEDQVTHITAVNYYHQKPRFQGRIRQSITLAPNGQTVVDTVNDWEFFDYRSDEANERTFAFVRKNTITSYDDAGNPMSRITTDYDYDKYGNVTEENKTEHNYRTDLDTTRFVRTQYNNNSADWILGQPLNIRTDATDPGSPGYPALRETRMAYDSTRPWLLKEQQAVYWEEGVEKTTTIAYDYDTFGNPTWVSNPRDPSWGTSTDYSESNGMFPNLTTNTLGHAVHRVFDARFGVVTEETLNPSEGNLQKTTTLYDEFGRLSQITSPEGSTRNYIYNIDPGNHYIRVSGTLMPTATTWYDNLDRPIRQEADDGIQPVFTDTIYNDAGQVWKKSLPYYSGNNPEYTVYIYEPLRARIQSQTSPDGTSRTIEYDGFEQTVTDENRNHKTITKDSLGRLIKVVEPTGGITEYDYDLFGNLIWIKDPLGNQTQIFYDDLGRKIAMDDPYMGHWEYKYDEAGNLTWQKDGKDQIVEMTYDALNRLKSKNCLATGRLVEYTYDEAHTGFFNTGALTTLTSTDPGSLFNTITYNYDLMGRTVSDTRTIDGVGYTSLRQYDAAGRPDIITYPDGATRVDYDYTPMGHLDKVYKLEADDTRTLLAEYGGYNAMGQIGSRTYGNGSATSYDYWPGNHRLKWMQTTAQISPGNWGAVQDLEYHFDDLGNVKAITDAVNGTNYEFDYDSVNRLTHALAYGSDPDRHYDQAYTYDLAGNMTVKAGKGGFQVQEWQDAQKHIRPATVAFEQNFTGVGAREIVYDQDNKPVQITYNGQTSYLSYDGQGNRVKKTGGGQSTIYVGGLYEINNGQAVVHIFAGGQRIASIKAGHKYYTHGDHLGSTGLVTDDNGLRVEEIGYLPFGATLFRKAYNNGDWRSVYRFTGQEYDAEYALYNYNARLYDPVLGRFITADTVVPDWTDPQSLNRYAYCRNNPLLYVDPSGHFAWGVFFIGLLKAVAVGAAIGAVAGGIMAAMNGGNFWLGARDGAVSGAISGAMFYCAGFGTVSNPTTAAQVAQNAAVHAVAGAASGAVNAAISGGDIQRGALIGGISGGVAKGIGDGLGGNPAARVLGGAVSGGIASAMTGGDFVLGAIQGAWTAIVAYRCNDLMHDITNGIKQMYGTFSEMPEMIEDAFVTAYDDMIQNDNLQREVYDASVNSLKIVGGTKAFVFIKAGALYIAATNPHAAKDGWHFLKLGYHSIGKTVITRNLGHAYSAGKYLHLNIANRHFIIHWGKIIQQIKFFNYLK